MSLRKDERKPTSPELEAYSKCIKLTNHTLSVCKVKENKTNRHHLLKRQLRLGNRLVDYVIEMGAYILEANNIYVGANLNLEERIANYKKRIDLQNKAKLLTYRMEHTIRVLHTERPFADSTITYWMSLLIEDRNLIIKWKEKDFYNLKVLMK